jgi:hypothetical protein
MNDASRTLPVHQVSLAVLCPVDWLDIQYIAKLTGFVKKGLFGRDVVHGELTWRGGKWLVAVVNVYYHQLPKT